MSARRSTLLVLTLPVTLAFVGLTGPGPVPFSRAARAPLLPEVRTAARFDVSPPLADLADGRGSPVSDGLRDQPAGQSLAGEAPTIDGALSAPTLTFEGLGWIIGSLWTGSNVNGDVGPHHYVQVVRGAFAVFTKDGQQLASGTTASLWTGFSGSCATASGFDPGFNPIVLYDQLADRWLLTNATTSGPTYDNCVALSTGPDPLGPYYRWAFGTGTNRPDSPKYAVWPDAYYLSTREYRPDGSFAGVGAYALDRAAMLAGNPLPTVVAFLAPTTPAYEAGDGLLPADLDGRRLPPAGSPAFFLGFQDDGGRYAAPTDALNLWEFHADFANPSASTFGLAHTLPTAPFDSVYPCSPGQLECLPQKGYDTTSTGYCPSLPGGCPPGCISLGGGCAPLPVDVEARKLDHGGYVQRLLQRAAYRNFGTHASIVTGQSVEAASYLSGVRWYEIRDPHVAPSVFQQANVASPQPAGSPWVHRWVGSIAQDRRGNMALGYSTTASNRYPGVAYTGRLVGDPLNSMPQPETTVVSSTAHQDGSNYWTAYTSMAVDPDDDCTFWYTNQYFASVQHTHNWGNTRVARFSFPSCGSTAPDDVDGDGTSDLTVYRRATGTWRVRRSGTGSSSTYTGGLAGDRPVRGDFDGDGLADLGVFRPGTGAWTILTAASGFTATITRTLGAPGDLPVPGDYDGDGTTDVAVFHPADGTWAFLSSSRGSTDASSYTWGVGTDWPVPADYDGDGRTDLAVYRRSTGRWMVQLSSTGFTGSVAYTWGAGADRPVPGDYDGDGKADVAVYRGATGTWYLLYSGSGYTTFASYVWGTATDWPVPGDHDGDGRADLTVYRPTTGLWYSLTSSSGFAEGTSLQYGSTGDVPLGAVAPFPDPTFAGDFDGDRRADFAVFRSATGAWYLAHSSSERTTFSTVVWGNGEDVAVPGDYDGDGRRDVAVWRERTGTWYVLQSGTGFSTWMTRVWGAPGDRPVPGDYDGDGVTDIAVWRPTTGAWYILQSSTGFVSGTSLFWGGPGDQPVPGDYDGDGRADLAVWTGATGTWRVLESTWQYAAGSLWTWGSATDVPAPADYDGDGRTDLAYWRPSTGYWYVSYSSSRFADSAVTKWGGSIDVAAPADFDGDGRADLVVWRPVTGAWYLLPSSRGLADWLKFIWGAEGDEPLTARR